MNDKTATPCGFCKGTGIEPGQIDCVWCENTGIDWACASEVSKSTLDALTYGMGAMLGGKHVPLTEMINTTEQPDLLRSALEHIIKTVGQSRTQTRRLRWIAKRAELALAGRPYVAAEHELPVSVDKEHLKLLRQKGELKERLTAAEQRNAELSRAVGKFREAFVIAVGDRSPFAKCALAEVDAALKPAESEASDVSCPAPINWISLDDAKKLYPSQADRPCPVCFSTECNGECMENL